MQKDAEDFAKEIVSEPAFSGPVERFLARRAVTTASSAVFVAAVIIGVAFFGMAFDEPAHVHLAAIAAAVALCLIQDFARSRSHMKNLRRLAADLAAGDGGFLAWTRFDMSPALFAATVSEPRMLARIRIALGRRNAERRREDLARRIEASN